jgi:transposase
VARLRHETFFSLDALNERIAELLVDLNARKMKRYGASRRELFERLDHPALRPLPAEAFIYAEWKKARLNIDYHVELDHHYYSAPHTLVHEVLEARLTATTIELFRHGESVAVHLRSYQRGKHTTLAAHMPKAHQKHLEWSPSRIVNWATSIGPKTRELVEAILAERRHPEQGYRSCLGILRLGKSFGHERLEAAAARAVAVRARSYRHVELILKNGLDRLPSPVETDEEGATPVVHENIRGGGYYH